jgi:protein gp37
MGVSTAISWTDHTFNPWWGCQRVSPGCEHCYAETFAKRTGRDVWGKSAGRRFFGDRHWAEPPKWNAAAERAGRRALVFCASMADVFEDRRAAGYVAGAELDEQRERLWDLIDQTPWLTWQLLTKRPENVLDMVPGHWHDDFEATQCGDEESRAWWPDNVWIGATVEDQQRAGERIGLLLGIPAPVRFLSCEPLLGELVIQHRLLQIQWVICGGESGPGHRPLDLEHARSLRDQCTAAGVPFFFKQVGGRTPTAGGDLLDGVEHKAFPKVLDRV